MPPVQEQAQLREVLPPALLEAAHGLELSLEAAGYPLQVRRVVRHLVSEAERQIVWTKPLPHGGYVEHLFVSLLLDNLFEFTPRDVGVLGIVLGALSSPLLPKHAVGGDQ